MILKASDFSSIQAYEYYNEGLCRRMNILTQQHEHVCQKNQHLREEIKKLQLGDLASKANLTTTSNHAISHPSTF